MKIFLQPYIQELKTKVLEIAQIDNIIAADCYKLALDISTKTHKTISQTTIKRVYGFAQARYAPSTFTLNALSQFCGYDSWANFIQQTESQKEKAKQHISWNEIAQAAHNITRFTIQTNKHKCGLSYLYTIERKTITDHIERFLNTNCTACVISAPSGTGKTIGVTHWVEKQLTESHTGNSNHIFLHVNSSSLFFAAGFGFHSNKWLAHLLNFPQYQYFEDFIAHHQKQAPGNFYLIIDDFNNNLINNRLFDIVFKQLIDMVAYLSTLPWMKVIITVRPSTWQKYGYLIENHPETNKLWFTNFAANQRAHAINLQPFSSSEIEQLIANINGVHSKERNYSQKYFDIIKLPLHFQYYYQMKGNTIDAEDLNPADEYAIASLYLNKSILKGALAAEKQILLNHFIKLLRFDEDFAYIDKKEAYYIIKENNNIYNELLHTGIIQEFQKDQGTRSTYQIRFRSIVLAAYFIAQEDLEKQDNRSDKALIEGIISSYHAEKIKLAALKWLIIFAMESGDLRIFNALQDTDSTVPYQASLFLFACSNLDYIIKANPNIKPLLNDSLQESAIIDLAFDHIIFEKEYPSALKKLLQFQLSYRQKILMHTALAFFELFYLRDEGSYKHIEELQTIPPEHFAEFSINPLLLMENIHYYYRFNRLKDDGLQEIALFCMYPERNVNLTHKQLIYMLGYMILKIKSDANLMFNYLNVINQYAIGIDQKSNGNFKASLHLAFAERHVLLGQLNEALQEKEKALITLDHANILSRFHMGFLELELKKHADADFLSLVRQLILIAKQFGLKYCEAKIRAYLLKKISKAENTSVVSENEAAMKVLFKQSNYKMESFYNLFNANFISSSTVN